MASFSRMMSNYRKFRVYNRYSYPLSLFFIDVSLFVAKAVAILCLAWLLYSLGSGLFGQSRNALHAVQSLNTNTVESRSRVAADVSARQLSARPSSELPGPQLTSDQTDPLTVPETSATGSQAKAGLQSDAQRLAVNAVPENAALKDDVGAVGAANSETTQPIRQQSLLDATPSRSGTGSGEVSEGDNSKLVVETTTDGLAATTGSRVANTSPAVTNTQSNTELADTELAGTLTKPVFEPVTEPEFEVVSLSGIASELDPEAEADRYSVIDMAPVAGEIWLQSQLPGDYTVQYGTSTSVALLEQFTGSFPTESDTIIFQFSKLNAQREPVFGIVHGVYASAAEARRAIEEMPSQLLQYEPWVRRIDQLKEVAKAR